MTSLGQLPSHPQPAEPQDQIEASSVLENGTDPSTTFYTKLELHLAETSLSFPLTWIV